MNIFYISFLKIEPGLFSIVNHAFSLVFRGLFLYKIIMEPEKKSLKIKSRIGRTLFPDILIEGLFSTGLF